MHRLGIVVLALATSVIGCEAENPHSEEFLRGDLPEPVQDDLAALITDDDTLVGEVRVSREGDFLHIRWVAENDWLLTRTHLALGETLDAIPTKANGCPKVGKFPWIDELDPPSEVHSTVVNPEELNLAGVDVLVVAAYAEVESVFSAKANGWGQGAPFPGCSGNARYFVVDLSPPPLDLEVTHFEVTPSTVHRGDIVSRSFGVRNVGSEFHDEPLIVRYWLSQDQVLAGNDLPLFANLLEPVQLQPGAVFGWITVGGVGSAQIGPFWVFVEALPLNSIDVDPTNNVMMDDDPLLITDGPLPSSDLAVTGFSTSPHAVVVGEQHFRSTTITNAGPDTFDGVVMHRFWASNDLLLGPEDFPAGQILRPYVISAGEAIEAGSLFKVPALPPGDYHFIVEVSTWLGWPDPNLGNQRFAEETPTTVNP